MTATGNQRSRFSHSIMDLATKLSDDIWYKIFLKLPVKSVLRCRSVCKAWRRLLCDHVFVRMHTKQHHQFEEKLLFRNDFHSFYSLDYREETQGKAVPRDFPLKVPQHILGYCNSLVWLGVESGIKVEDWDTVLWNPSTADYKILPNPRPSIMDHYVEAKQFQGLGYCDDYKIVRVTYTNSEYRQADVYTLRANSWKKFIEDISHDRNIMHRNPYQPGIALNGFIYWLVIYQLDGRFDKKILGFDLRREKFTELSLPPRPLCVKSQNLAVIEGYLGIYSVLLNGDVVVWRMLELDNQEKEWNNMMTISTQCKLGKELHHLHKLLFWLDKGKVCFCLKRRLVVYNLKNGILEEIYHFDGINKVRDWVTYSESLFSPNTC